MKFPIVCVFLTALLYLPAARSANLTCKEPPFIPFSLYTKPDNHPIPEEFLVGTTITYSCTFGYVIEGTDRTLHCVLTEDGDDAQWTKPQISCTPRSCGDPGFVSNGHRVGSLFTFPNSVSYDCDEGFRLVGGTRNRYCSASGSWSGSSPRCVSVTCEPPEDPDHGHVTYTSLDFGTELKIECDAGYVLNDSKPVTCTAKGTWNREESVCVEVACNVPQSPKHGSVILNVPNGRPLAGTIAVFSCDDGRIPIGRTTSKCLDIGQWTFPGPQCIEPCTVPEVPNGKIGRYEKIPYNSNQLLFKVIPFGTRVEDDEKLFLHCREGYLPLGITTNYQAKISCSGGIWSDDLFCEPPLCSTDMLNFYGLEKGDKKFYRNGEELLVVCNRRYKLAARHSGRFRCEEGVWKDALPPCVAASCSRPPPNIEHGNVIFTSLNHSSLARYICKDPYVQKGSNQVQCLFGEWTKALPECKHRDCSVPVINNGVILEKTLGPQKWKYLKFRYERDEIYVLVPHGSTPSQSASLYLACHKRYSVQGKGEDSVRIRCSQGRWSVDPVCLRDGAKYVPPTQVLPTASTSSKDIETTHKRETTPYSTAEQSTEESVCFCEYTLNDENVVAYTDGKQLQFHDRVRNFTTVKFRCKEIGYQNLIGKEELTCENCQPWHSTVFPQCVYPKLGDAVIIYDDNVNISLDGAIEIRAGQTVKLTCIAMQEAVFPEWSYPPQHGVSTVTNLMERDDDILYMTILEIKNSTFVNEGLYKCAVGENAPTEVELRVFDPSLQCPEFGYEEELDITNDSGTQVGSKATFSCRKETQILNGTNVLTCLRNGEWSNSIPQCTDITCGELEETDLLKISYTDERKVGGFANFHCFVPGKRSGVARTQCSENGLWKDPMPTCTASPCKSSSLFSIMPQGVTPDIEDVTKDTLPYNSTVRLTCERDFTVGNPVATCGKEGMWKVDKVQCSHGCLAPTKSPESKLIILPEKNTFTFGESLNFFCPTGSYLDRNLLKIMCLGSEWSETILPECVEQ